MKKTAVVLSGGGSCGSYQIGVWKALKKLKIEYHIITGSSVGALNGLLMVQNDFKKAYKLWFNINYDLMFEKFINNKDNNENEIYLKYVDQFIKAGGMDVSNLESVILENYDEKKFNNSSIDFGIIVYNLTKLKTESKIINGLSKEKLKDYIMASATCFPAFKIKNIGDNKYVDGGYGDNLPINLAIDLGAEKIIAIDLEQIGVKKIPKKKNIDIKYIKPKNDIGSFLIFEKNQARKNMKYGYNDTMKSYNVMKGDCYSFYKFGYNYLIKKLQIKIQKYLNLISKEENNKIQEIKNTLTKKFLQLDNLDVNEVINQASNILGKCFCIDDTNVYFIYNFNKIIKRKFNKIKDLDIEIIKEKIKNKQVNSLIGSKYIIKYIYNSIKNNAHKDLNLLYPLFKKEFYAALYLFCIE